MKLLLRGANLLQTYSKLTPWCKLTCLSTTRLANLLRGASSHLDSSTESNTPTTTINLTLNKTITIYSLCNLSSLLRLSPGGGHEVFPQGILHDVRRSYQCGKLEGGWTPPRYSSSPQAGRATCVLSPSCAGVCLCIFVCIFCFFSHLVPTI